MPDHSREVLETAYAWHAKSVDNDLSLEDRNELESWLEADRSHRIAFERAKLLWMKLDQVPRDSIGIDIDEIADASLVQKVRTWNDTALSNLLKAFGIAASITAIVSVSLFLLPGSGKQSEPKVYRTGIAERQDIQLSDGTLLALGPQSQVEITLTDDTRSVSLFSGQAYFDVARDLERPFRVLVGRISATVVGTQFVADRIGHSSRVAVSEGRVVVAPASLASDMRARELVRGDQVRMDRSGQWVYSETDANQIGAWRNGRWVFSNARLADVIADANRYSDQHIEILDPSIAAMTVSLSLDAGDVKALLTNLELAFSIRIREHSNGTIVISGQYE